MAAYTSDIVIFGATAVGIMAARAAAAQGRTVRIVEEGTHIGGMVTGGLSAIDIGTQRATYIGGYTRAFFDYLDSYYGKAVGTLTINPEPKACKAALDAALAAAGAGVTVHTSKTLTAVAKDGATITSATAGGDTFSASVFIDASYEGELMRLAKASNTYGREAKTFLNESTALSKTTAGSVGYGSNIQQQGITGTDADGQRLYGMNPIPRASTQQGDAHLGNQGFNFRLIMTSTPAIRQTVAVPVGYNAADYQVVVNYLGGSAGATVTKLVGSVGATDCILGGALLATNTPGTLKYDCNMAGLVSSNLYTPGFGQPGISWAYSTADRATRTAIATEHYRWLAGLVYYCQTDAAFGIAEPAVQANAQTYGWCTDEFQSDWFGQQGFPPQLYVREARRLVGQYIMRVEDVVSGSSKPDTIAKFNYSVDIHANQRHPRTTNILQSTFEGGYNQNPPAAAFAIPWRALIPAEGQADNLIVPLCISCTHLAWGALRLEPAMMMQGEAAGAAAHLAIAAGVPPVRLPYSRLRPALLAQGALL